MKYKYINLKWAEVFLFMTALGIYAINEVWLKQRSDNLFLQCYLNDVMAGICLSSIGQLLMGFWLKRHMKTIENLILICIAGLYWEYAAPKYVAGSVTDTYDMIAYLAGVFVFISILKLYLKNMIRRKQKMECKKCGHEFLNQEKFCPECGEKVNVVKYCPNCGNALGEEVKFCGSCGHSLVPENEAAFIPEPVEDKTSQGKPAVGSRGNKKKVDKVNNTTIVNLENPKTDMPKSTSHTENPAVTMEQPEIKIRTLELFKMELKELEHRESESKAAIVVAGTSVFYKWLFPILRNDEILISIRSIQGKFLFARYRKKFVVITDKRIIKFEKMQYLKPRIKSLFFEEIREIQADEPSNAVSGTFIGEKISILSGDDHRIDMRMVGKGAAKEFRECVMQEKKNHGDTLPESVSSEASQISFEKGGKGKRRIIIPVAGVLIVVTVLFIILASTSIESEVVEKVRNGYLGNYSDVTIGDVFGDVLNEGIWNEMITNTDEFNIVQYKVKTNDTVIQFQIRPNQEIFVVCYMKYMGETMPEASDCKIKLDAIYAEYYKKHPELGNKENTSWDNVTTDGSFTSMKAIETVDQTKTVESQSEFSTNYFVILDSDKRYLDDNEIGKLTDNEKLTAMYEILARHGAVFLNVDDGDKWQTYFNSQEWYTPTVAVEEIYEEDLNAYEVGNVERISENIAASIASNDGPEYQNYMILPNSDSIYYIPDDLAELTNEELRLARNEIYAKHGRKFETEDLNQYFSSQSWYQGYLSAEEFDDSVLNEFEKANLDLIKQVEQGESYKQPSVDVNNTYAEYKSIDGLGCVVVNGETYYSLYDLNYAPDGSKAYMLGNISIKQDISSYALPYKYEYTIFTEDRASGTVRSNQNLDENYYALICGSVDDFDDYKGALIFNGEDSFILPGSNLMGVQ